MSPGLQVLDTGLLGTGYTYGQYIHGGTLFNLAKLILTHFFFKSFKEDVLQKASFFNCHCVTRGGMRVFSDSHFPL